MILVFFSCKFLKQCWLDSFPFFLFRMHNFVRQMPAAWDYGFRLYGELARFVYCLLQKIKKPDSLPALEQWECYMLPNHSGLATIDYGFFRSGTTLMSASEKTNSAFFRKDFRKNVSLFWGLSEYYLLQSLCSFACWSWDHSLLPGESDWRWWPFRFLSIQWVYRDVRATRAGWNVVRWKPATWTFNPLCATKEYGPVVSRPDIGNILFFYEAQYSFRSRKKLFMVNVGWSSGYAWAGVFVDSSCCISGVPACCSYGWGTERAVG